MSFETVTIVFDTCAILPTCEKEVEGARDTGNGDFKLEFSGCKKIASTVHVAHDHNSKLII